MQTLVTRGDLPLPRLRRLESSVVDQLFICIHSGNLDTQNQLLHLLHSVILAISAGTSTRRTNSSPAVNENSGSSEGRSSLSRPRTSISEVNNPLLLRVLQDGITVKANRCLLQFWVDFILMTVPHLEGSLQPVAFPLCDTICNEIRNAVDMWRSKAYGDGSPSEAEVIMLLSCLERVVLIAMTWSNVDSDRSLPKGSSEVAGLFGYVTTMLQTDQASAGNGGVRPELSPQNRPTEA
jgi:hypothetical protein